MDPAPRTDTEPDWRLVGLVRASPALTAVLRELVVAEDNRISQRALSKRAGVSFGHMSEHLTKLLELGLAKCLTPNVRKGKLYCATDPGRGVTKEILRIEELEKGRITSGGAQVENKGPI
jgi:hypothetical protein